MKRTFVVGLIALAACGCSGASTIFGVIDCGQWLTDTPSEKANNRFWLIGFVSGMNVGFDAFNPPADHLNKISSVNQMFVWMDNYCQKNPLNKVSQGADALFIELVKKK